MEDKEDDESQVQVQVRSLRGESITLSISSTKSIQDLKSILLQRFPPASNSPTFHLFLRGVKLGLPGLIGSHAISPGDFFVLVPFSKKGRTDSSESQQPPGASTGRPQVLCEGTALDVAESAWSEMIEDLSYFHRASDTDEQADALPGDKNSNMGYGGADTKLCYGENEVVETLSGTKNSSSKRKTLSDEYRAEGLIHELFCCVLQFPEKNVWDKEIRESFFKVLESVNCLADQYGNCMLLEETNLCNSSEPLPSCVCPPWLKAAVNAFTFLNILMGFLQVRREILTFEFVKDALDKFAEFGFLLGVEDLERLSVLCPKVV
ncbi:hypothetical protein Dimus_005082 [Dionaea muscipula]